jgi:hypothetical protein
MICTRNLGKETLAIYSTLSENHSEHKMLHTKNKRMTLENCYLTNNNKKITKISSLFLIWSELYFT